MKKDFFNQWIVDNFGGNTAKEGIERKVNELLTETKQTQLPVRLSEISKIIGINHQPIYQNQNSWGQLITRDNEFRISLKMKTGKPPSINWSGYPALRFGYAHELIHCLFYDFTYQPPKRKAPVDKKSEEILCNYGASLLLLPSQQLNDFMKENCNRNIIKVAKDLSDKSYVSFYACIIRLINEDFFQEKKNKLYILSSISEGLHNTNIKKPRCLISVIYNGNEKRKTFIPTYKGLDIISDSWSLQNYHKNGYLPTKVFIQNEIIEFQNNKYVINGTHELINNAYVWSDLKIQEL